MTSKVLVNRDPYELHDLPLISITRDRRGMWAGTERSWDGDCMVTRRWIDGNLDGLIKRMRQAEVLI